MPGPECPGRDCDARTELLGDANEVGESWECPVCGRFGVLWAATYAEPHQEDPVQYLGRRNLRPRHERSPEFGDLPVAAG